MAVNTTDGGATTNSYPAQYWPHGQTIHERIRTCMVCELAPACVTYKADAVTIALCVTCYRGLHSSNLLARHHDRIPVIPLFDSAEAVHLTAGNMTDPAFSYGFQFQTESNSQSSHKYEINSNIRTSNKTCNKSNSQSCSLSVSSSLMDAGVVHEENALLDVSNPIFMLPVKQLSATDRKARVLRYREKRKKRKFEKKIRYASRKAYAEMRPRIKGRFAKHTESMKVDVDRWWFTQESSANSYGL